MSQEISGSTSTSSWPGRSAGNRTTSTLSTRRATPSATEDAPFLQIGESKYGRPILDWGVRRESSLEDAARYASISLDSTMRSNVAVGPPLDLLVYARDELRITRQRRFGAQDPDFLAIQTRWEQSLRKAVQELPRVWFDEPGTRS